MDDALLVLLLTAAACAPLGVFLILRRLSMMADAISHTVLLGIVLALLTSPKGAITSYIRRLQSIRQMQRDLFLLHIGRHTAEHAESAENHRDEIGDHLKWDDRKIQRVSRELIERRLLRREGSYYLLTDAGAAQYAALCKRYFL